MIFLPPPISKEARRRTLKCVRCEKLTDPALSSCDFCGHHFSDEERRRMEVCHEERRRPSFSALVVPILLVALVLIIVLS